jgi:hypothetical protein
MTTKTDGDRLLRAAVTVLSTPGWGLHERKLKPLFDVVESIVPGRVERARTTVKRQREQQREAARWEGNVPAWAKRLVNKYDDSLRVIWRVSRTGRVRGQAFFTHISITAGTNDEHSQRILVLHELAHVLAGLAHGHDDAFWDELYRIAVAEHMVEAIKGWSNHTRGMRAAARRVRQNRSASA